LPWCRGAWQIGDQPSGRTAKRPSRSRQTFTQRQFGQIGGL